MDSVEIYSSESEPEGNWAKNSSQPELPGMLNPIPTPEEQTKEEITSLTSHDEISKETPPNKKIETIKSDPEKEVKYVDVREKDEKLLRAMLGVTYDSYLNSKKIINFEYLIESVNLKGYIPKEVEKAFKKYYAAVKGHPGYRWPKENLRFPSKKKREGGEDPSTFEKLVKDKKSEEVIEDIPMTAYTEWLNNN